MYKIMFVDDEPLILRRLHQILDWHSLGFKILADALDGQIALELIKNDIPDVIICDINMPNMDGLQLIQQIRKDYPTIQCVMLTVNDSFACAQQALNIGVNHYLLKPIELDKLMHLMEKVISILDASKENDQYLHNLYHKAITSEKMIREKFLNWIASGRHPLSEQQIREKFQFYRIPIDAKEFQIISIHINAFEKHFLDESSIEGLLNTAIQSIEDTLCDYQNCILFSDSFYNLNILMGSNPQNNVVGPSIDFMCQSLRDHFMFHLNLPVTILYSRKYQGAQNIYRCYYDTKLLSKYTPAPGNEGIISFDEYARTVMAIPIDFDAMRSYALKQLRTYNYKSLENYLIESLSSYVTASFESLNMLRIDFVMTGIMFLHENKTSLNDIFGKYFDPLVEVMEMNDISECLTFLCSYYQKIISFTCSNKVSSGRRMAEKCMELIEENLSSPELSVKWLASQLYINENYLSRQFRAEMNVPLIKYIMNQRLEAGKNYLDMGYTNLQAVSQLIGFTDPLYFSKCFKKKYGIAPSKYN